MIIEYVGLPGAGKTYESELEAKHSGLSLMGARTRAQRYGRGLWFIARHPRIAWAFISLAVRENRQGARALRHKILFLLMQAFAYEEQARGYGGIIDEGLLLLVLTFFDRPITVADLANIAPYLPTSKGRVVYVVEAPRALRAERMRARGRTPRGFLGARAQQEFLDVLERNLPVYADFLKQRYGAQIVLSGSRT